MTYRHKSYWIDTVEGSGFPQATGSIGVDVAIVGGGIVGLTAALLLKRVGVSVAVIDAGRVASSVTGHTTAKVTAGHGLIYSQLTKELGESAAATYAQSNQAAVEKIATIAKELDIDCDLEPTDNYVFGESADEVDTLKQEAEAASKAGLKASFTTDNELPFPIVGAVRHMNQAQFHPRKYLEPIASFIDGDGSFVFENSRVMELKEGDPCTLGTPEASISADKVILATHFPAFDRGLFFAKVHPYRAYVVAARVDESDAPAGMWINAGSPSRSVRSAPYGDGRLLIVTGEGHKTGQDSDTEERYAALEQWTRERFGVESFDYRWSTQDNVSVDHVPYVGRLRRGSENVFTATGFAGWGMTNGTMSAMLLTDLVRDIPNQWHDLYDSNRLNPGASAKKFVEENVEVAYRFFSDRIKAISKSIDDVPPGEGGVIGVGAKQVAVRKGVGGEVKALSAVCTHLGCIVQWNRAEKTWDCPCHGSRFDDGGGVIQGPASKPLRPVDLTERDES